jgi:hypothetical protein
MPQISESEKERTSASVRNVNEPAPDGAINHEAFSPAVDQFYGRFWEGVLDVPRVFRLIRPANEEEGRKRFEIKNNCGSGFPGVEDGVTVFFVDWFFEKSKTDPKTRMTVTERVHPFRETEAGVRIFPAFHINAVDFLDQFIPVDFTPEEWSRTLKKHAACIKRERKVLEQAAQYQVELAEQRKKLARPLADQIADALAKLVVQGQSAQPKASA